MPTHKEALSAAQKRLTRLKELGQGVRVHRVLGARVLVKTVVPITELDQVETRGLLVLPESVKAEYTPLPTTGVVLEVGPDVPTETWYVGTRRHEDVEYKATTLHPGTNVADLSCVERCVLQPGDMVLFPRLSGMDFTIAEQDLRILHVNDIMAVLADTDDSVVEVDRVPEVKSAS